MLNKTQSSITIAYNCIVVFKDTAEKCVTPTKETNQDDDSNCSSCSTVTALSEPDVGKLNVTVCNQIHICVQ